MSDFETQRVVQFFCRHDGSGWSDVPEWTRDIAVDEPGNAGRAARKRLRLARQRQKWQLSQLDPADPRYFSQAYALDPATDAAKGLLDPAARMHHVVKCPSCAFEVRVSRSMLRDLWGLQYLVMFDVQDSVGLPPDVAAKLRAVILSLRNANTKLSPNLLPRLRALRELGFGVEHRGEQSPLLLRCPLRLTQRLVAMYVEAEHDLAIGDVEHDTPEV